MYQSHRFEQKKITKQKRSRCHSEPAVESTMLFSHSTLVHCDGCKAHYKYSCYGELWYDMDTQQAELTPLTGSW